jgi:hypothetical protein
MIALYRKCLVVVTGEEREWRGDLLISPERLLALDRRTPTAPLGAIRAGFSFERASSGPIRVPGDGAGGA